MEKTEKFRMRRYSKKTPTNINATPMRGVNNSRTTALEHGSTDYSYKKVWSAQKVEVLTEIIC